MGRNGLKWVILDSFLKRAVTEDVDGRIQLRNRRERPPELSGQVSRKRWGESFVVARWLDNCLVAYPTEKWQEQAEKLKALAGIKNRLIVSYLFASGIVVQPDKQGRILLPGGHRDHAKLDKEVTIIGVGDHAEIWNTQAWHAAVDYSGQCQIRSCAFGNGVISSELSPISLSSSRNAFEGLAIQPDGTYLDGTAGGAGHSRRNRDASGYRQTDQSGSGPGCRRCCKERLAGLPATVVQMNFRYADQALAQLGVEGWMVLCWIWAFLLTSWMKFLVAFSYQGEAPLDMRMSQSGPTAADLVNHETREELARILRSTASRMRGKLPEKIVLQREKEPISDHFPADADDCLCGAACRSPEG